ncbi:HNH endonuclease [Streptomyces phage Phredrick]|uniref:HNH endonuclease n=1 Tax=Streptomyces phage Gilson TaxID=2488789 RepID=A0A3T0ID25_9CAUD|nr:HNH endonuclease [Streptomyces phage Gilson]AZU97282.1 HNH endonuclease [Streptomyces phage Gilson]WNN94795.1 HNH endonuclease [Streptomyces phage Phredrick]
MEKRRYSKYSDEEILEAIRSTPNFTQAAILLGINRKTVQRVAHSNGIESDKRRIPDHDKVLVIKDGRDGNIKTYIRKHKLIEEVCIMCGNDGTWQGKKLVLQLDHINGNPGDNRIENLRWLCPNCHSQTPTFTNRKR